MEMIVALISDAVFLLLYLLLYFKLVKISDKLSAQDIYYKKLIAEEQKKTENEKYLESFGKRSHDQ